MRSLEVRMPNQQKKIREFRPPHWLQSWLEEAPVQARYIRTSLECCRTVRVYLISRNGCVHTCLCHDAIIWIQYTIAVGSVCGEGVVLTLSKWLL